MQNFTVVKVLNNNVLIAKHESYGEVIVIGKGIGFGKKKNDDIPQSTIEKMFVLKSEKEQEQYKKLIPNIDEDFIAIMNDIIHMINKRLNKPLNEHIHIGLTDHLAFTIKRLEEGLEIHNPFLLETHALYPKEYETASAVVKFLEETLHVSLPEGEIGFIALHIHSAITNRNLQEVNQNSQLIHKLIEIIEDSLEVEVNYSDVNYLRLVRHLQFAIERVKSGELVVEPKKLAEVLKEEYPLCYNVAWKLIKVMQQTLQLPVYHAEAVYLTLHLQRLSTKTEL
ncbi:glucose PTS transporter transcription antiterminator GlcT [Bacillus sp. SCS-151]|uniref:glucose PTS transporter transcription antiterminator GlcT n=1 Tax=Nanhaiella sioensis TaxID=3115293 RepID=UPI003978B3F3